MLRSQAQGFLLVLGASVLLVEVGGASRSDQLTETLQADLVSDKEQIRSFLLRFVSDLMGSREEMLPRLEDEDLGGKERLMRRHIRFSQRERKAGCRNFFWKTFTSC